MNHAWRAALGILIALASASPALARIDVECHAGKPYGVGRITVGRNDVRGAIDDASLFITERNRRVHYPAFQAGRVGPIIGRFIGGAGSVDNFTVTFLFSGDEPLKVTLYTPEPIVLDVVPHSKRAREHERLLTRWWRDYNANLRDQQDEGDYPPLVQTYLAAVLSQRLNLQPPLLSRGKETPPSEGQEILEVLAGTQRLREATMRDTLLGRSDREEANIPLPPAIAWPEIEAPFDEKLPIEAIAAHVPRDWFYARFGRFNNFLWLNKLLEEHGGDLGRLVTTRGFRQPLNARLQMQLSMKTDALAELLGETAIADVALVGRDMFMQEGAAMGVLFHARNSGLLARDFNGKRKAVFDRDKKAGCTLETVKIAGKDVSFLSTPDNRIRSFYAIDGDFHLITTSQAMVEQFLTLQKEQSLAQAAEFRHARTKLPLDRNDTAFVFASSYFLRGLVSPQYQTELRRRLQSVTDMEILELARMAAQGDGAPASTIDELIAGGYAPRGFGKRPDGSGIVMTDDGSLDSLRGSRGTFTPIPDVAIELVTPSEAARAQRQAQFYASSWKQMDPIFAAVGRFKKNETGLERIVVDAYISPFEESKYGWVTSMLGPPVENRITAAAGDVIQVQAFLSGGLLDPSVGPHHMFLGVQDHVPLTDLRSTNLLKTLELLRTTPGYLGAWPKTGFIDRLPLGLAGTEPDAYGYSKMLFGLWRRQGDGFSVLSFDPQLLATVTPQLAVVPSEDRAQIRIHVANLAETKVTGLVNSLYYEQARRTSVGNAKLMQVLVQQLGVPIDAAKAEAEKLVDAELVCTLGGDYTVTESRSGLKRWTSTAWPTANYQLPADYVSPLLVWFRGLDAGLTKSPDQLVAHIELEMQRAKGEEPKFELPQFNLGNLFGGGTKPKEALEPVKPKPLFPNNPPEVKREKQGTKEF